jgi:hypothetical protein
MNSAAALRAYRRYGAVRAFLGAVTITDNFYCTAAQLMGLSPWVGSDEIGERIAKSD